jgi:hypothetical protein
MPGTLAEIQNRAIREALERNRWNQTHTARELDISIRTIARWIKVNGRTSSLSGQFGAGDNCRGEVTIDVGSNEGATA